MTPHETAQRWAIQTLQQASLNPEHHPETCNTLARLYTGLLTQEGGNHAKDSHD